MSDDKHPKCCTSCATTHNLLFDQDEGDWRCIHCFRKIYAACVKAQARTIVALAEALGTSSKYKNKPTTYAAYVLNKHAEAIEMARKELADDGI